MRLPRSLPLLACLLLAACAPPRSVRVEPAQGPQPRSAPAGLYEVVRGDTLYGIAFRHGLDYRDLAVLNGIAAPFTIYPGQRLRLRGKPPRSAPAERGVVGSVVGKPAPAAAPPAAPTAPAAPAAPPAAPTVSSAPPVAAEPPPATPPRPLPATPDGPPRWQWPADGQIVASFRSGDPTRQGINIAGRAGDPVQAAADGVVVYSGSGLIGYGELIIIKHSDNWLSAYGHNRKRLVDEGASVRGGQRIAEIGRTGASRDMLHFEVRRNGRPVDPLGVLPKR